LKDPEIESITHLTFDCYGTLIDWRNGIETHLGGLLRRKGLSSNERVYPTYVKLEAEEEGSYKKYNEILSNTARKVATSFGLVIDEKEADIFSQSVPNWEPFTDAVASLLSLGELGLKRIILSNIDTEILRATIEENNLDVDGYITAEEIGSYKPAFGHWKSFFEKYRVQKSKVLHVAQSIFHDIIPAANLGISTAWINRYGEPTPRDVIPTFSLQNLSELNSLFSRSKI
jgi:2-haloalkanoic acid dehalogenase type II